MWTGLDCDDDLALLISMALERRGKIKWEGLSICGGNAPLMHTWPNVHRLLESVSYPKNRLVPKKGIGWNSMQLTWKSNRFFHWLHPDDADSNDAIDAIVNISHSSSPVSILMLGPPTNLARALEKGIGKAIEHVYLMGGELTGQPLDLNFGSDRAAARSVLQSDKFRKTIIPIQTCGQVIVTRWHLENLLACHQNKATASNWPTACALMPKMVQQVYLMPKWVNPHVEKRLLHGTSRWKLSPNLTRGFVPWDVVALLAITHSDELFTDWEYHRVEVPSCIQGEPCDRNISVASIPLPVDDVLSNSFNWSNVVRVPHTIRNEAQFLDTMFDLLRDVQSEANQAPRMFWGFLPTITTVFGVPFATLFVLYLCNWSTQKRKYSR